jgi:hypothetical protein
MPASRNKGFLFQREGNRSRGEKEKNITTDLIFPSPVLLFSSWE